MAGGRRSIADIQRPLSELFRPGSAAVVGASRDPMAQSYRYLRLLQEFGFRGPIYPVNPQYADVLGLRCYPDLLSVPTNIDFVISCVPAAVAPQVIEHSAQKGVKLIHFFTARFSETGRQTAAALEQELLQKARRHGLRLLGPNCMGLYNPEVGLSFKYNFPRESGSVGILSQSGGLATRIVFRGGARGLRFTQAVSYGNGLDINESDLLEHFAADPNTKVIGVYIEGVRDGRRFLRTIREVAYQKPIVLLKGGRTSAGAKATRSHTASLAGERQVWSGLARQAGVIEAGNPDEMVDILLAFSLLPPAHGLRVGVVGGGGGCMVQAADGCEEAGLVVEPLPSEMRAWLKEKAPQIWDWVTNPVDQSILGGAGVAGEEILKEMASGGHFDLLLGIASDDGPGEPSWEQEMLKRVMGTWIELRGQTQKPLAAILGTTESPEEWRWQWISDARQRLAGAGVPVYPSLERAALALSRFARYWLARRGEAERKDEAKSRR